MLGDERWTLLFLSRNFRFPCFGCAQIKQFSNKCGTNCNSTSFHRPASSMTGFWSLWAIGGKWIFKSGHSVNSIKDMHYRGIWHFCSQPYPYSGQRFVKAQWDTIWNTQTEFPFFEIFLSYWHPLCVTDFWPESDFQASLHLAKSIVILSSQLCQWTEDSRLKARPHKNAFALTRPRLNLFLHFGKQAMPRCCSGFGAAMLWPVLQASTAPYLRPPPP